MQTLISKTFEINKSQDISYEIFKDEIIIINLKSGKYFQIENSGVEIFKNIKNNLTTEENIRSFIPQNNKNKLEIIKFTEQGDKNVTIADKLFVFLSHIDSLGSPEALKTHITEASQDWLKRANLPVNRIVSGSAGAYLILNNLAEEHTQLEIGQASNIQDKLKTLTGIIDDEMLKTPYKTYRSDEQTILKKYSEQPKVIKKVFGVENKRGFTSRKL
jgi:hypothetical protein